MTTTSERSARDRPVSSGADLSDEFSGWPGGVAARVFRMADAKGTTMSNGQDGEAGIDPQVVIVDLEVVDADTNARTLEAMCYSDGTIFGGTAGLVRKFSGQNLRDVIRQWRNDGLTVVWAYREEVQDDDDELFSDEEPDEPVEPVKPAVQAPKTTKRAKRVDTD